MGQLVVRRKAIPITYPGAGGTQIIQLNKSLVYRYLYINLQCQPTLTAGNNSVANTARGDEWGVVKRLRIIANSSDVLYDMTGDQLWWFARYQFGTDPLVTSILGNGSTANPTINSVLAIPFVDRRARKPYDTAYDSGGLTDFRIELTFGNYTDINTAATAWTAQPVIVVTTCESELGTYTPLFIPRRVAQQQIVAGASTAYRFPLDVGPIYRGLLINATTNASPAVDTAGLITNVRVVSGSTIFADLDEQSLYQGVGTLEQSLDFEQKATGASAGVISQLSPRVNPNANTKAWYNLDFLTDGYLTEAINTSGLNEFYVEFALSAGCVLNVISQQMLLNPAHPVAQAAAQAINSGAVNATSVIASGSNVQAAQQTAAAITAATAPTSGGNSARSAHVAHVARKNALIAAGRKKA